MTGPVDSFDWPRVEYRSGALSELDPEVRVRALGQMAEESWLWRSEFGYLVTTYDDSVALLRDRRLHQASQLVARRFAGEGTALDELDSAGLLSAEGETHARLRRLVAPAFSPRSIDRLRPFMADYLQRTLDDLECGPDGTTAFDGYETFAHYPIAVICHHLNIERADWDQFGRWAETTFLLFSSMIKGDEDRVVASLRAFTHYCSELVEARRAQPGDDLISELIAVEEEGDRLSNRELVSLVLSVIAAGVDTTRNQLALALAVLAERPEWWQELPDVGAQHVVEESLRYLQSIRGVIRRVNEPLEYRGVSFPADTLIAMSLAAANRDESHFSRADEFAPTREFPQPQLAFSTGIHHCLGAFLARAELAVALTTLREKFTTLELCAPVQWRDERLAIWGPSHVPLLGRVC